MPYILSPRITKKMSGMWQEGAAYEKRSIYSIEPGKLPPVNYDEHILRPHSLTHLETPAHTQQDGKTLENYIGEPSYFFGKVIVLKLKGNRYEDLGNGIFHWTVTREELQERLKELGEGNPQKVFITTELYHENEDGFHDPRFVLTLSQEAADFLVEFKGFHLFGTSWKSSDYNPGSLARPIHNTLFKKCLILENLALKSVPEGSYFLSAFPLLLDGASESPVVPVLYTAQDLSF
jgi:kynurenine formamidase